MFKTRCGRSPHILPRGARTGYPNGIEPVPKQRAGIRMQGYDAVADWKQFAALRKYIDGGKLDVPVAAQFPLGQAARALAE